MKFQPVLTLKTRDWILSLKSRASATFESTPKAGAEVRVRAPGFEESPGHRIPSIFENRIYTVTVEPRNGETITAVRHPLIVEVEESLEQVGLAWHGTLKTGNDIGWFTLEILVKAGEIDRIDLASWQVWPLKLDLATDLRELTKSIEKTYPLWLFRFKTPTSHDAGRTSRSADPFLLLWIANFRSLWDELSLGLRTVILQPHVRLTATTTRRRADQLRGRLNPRLEEQVSSRRLQPQAKLPAEVWASSLDTPENRFVREVLDRSLDGLSRFQAALTMPGLSTSFRTALTQWIRQVRGYRSASMFRGLAPYSGQTQESLVLHHRAGYSAVYRSWLKLRQTLQFFSAVSQAQVGLRSVSELYEIWCLVQVKELLIQLGYTERAHLGARWTVSPLERSLENGQGAAFVLTHPTGPEIRLSHEPVFHRNTKERFRSLSVAQKPDIVLEAIWKSPEGSDQRLLWIFDAKYRVKSPSFDHSDRDEGRSQDWLVPPDALDQMHRYRDAILHGLDRTNGITRPVVSAFALYPARMNQTSDNDHSNPYFEAIERIGIGAFPLVPGEAGGVWLKSFLSKTFLEAKGLRPEDVVHQPSVKIPVELLRYREDDLLILDLTRLNVPHDPEEVRSSGMGSLTLATPLKASRQKVSAVTWVALVVRDPVGTPTVHGARMLSTRFDGEGSFEFSDTYLQFPRPTVIEIDSGPAFRYAELRDYLGG